MTIYQNLVMNEVFMMNSYFNKFEDELLPNEELICTERVKEPFNFNPKDIVIVGLLLILISGVQGVVGVIVGLVLSILLYFFIIESRDNIYYALTNYRIIIKSDSSKIKIESINIKSLKKVKMEKDGYGLGTIILEEKVSSHGDYGARQVVLPRLESIKNAELVYEEILKVQGY